MIRLHFCYLDSLKCFIWFFFFCFLRQLILNCFANYTFVFSQQQPHRPRNDGSGGGGGRHKKRVRQPHNTRERQRQLAVGHGEYIMPSQGVMYRTSHTIPDDGMLGMVMTDNRPPRPNSIELRRSYPPEEHSIYSPPTADHYRYCFRHEQLLFDIIDFFIYYVHKLYIFFFNEWHCH